VKPGQVIRYVSPERAEARLILFTPEFPAPDALDLDMPDAVTLGDDAFPGVLALANALFDEYAGADDARSPAILRHLLTGLLLKLDRAAHGGPVADTDTDVYRGFRRALAQPVLAWRRVEDYARLLGCTPRTLHRVAVGATGRGAKALIDERVALEAKRLLAHTPLGVGAIAARLGFSEPTNFVKFFRRVTGMLPGAFREAARP
jgi:AraC-like DNA-binding protein